MGAMSRVPFIWIMLLAPVCLGLGTSSAAEPLPAHAGTRLLRSGALVIEVGDPASPECRWNKGLRFSPVANVLRAQLHGQEFLYSPVTGGALTYLGGLPMEFDIGQEAFQPDPPGYNEGANGDPFLKIGVGILRRDAGAYSFSKSYPVVEPARTIVTWQTDRAHFVQTLGGHANGYCCHLEGEAIVKNDRLILNYLLRNTGSKPFTTEQYLHNFLCFSGKSVGPNVRLSFPYDFTTNPAVTPWQPSGRVRDLRAAAAAVYVRVANSIEFTDRASGVPKIWIYKPHGYTGPELCAVEHADTQQRVIAATSIPAAYVGIWTTDYQVSPEQFLLLTLAPGEETRFSRTFIFRVDGFVPQDSTGDNVVDVRDLSRLSSAWLRQPGDVGWEPACDVSAAGDDRIDLRDLAALARQWSQNAGLGLPVAHWKLQETTGSMAADERGRYPGVLRDFPADNSQWLPGGGLRFDGIDDRVEIRGLPLGSGHPRTLTAWIRLHSIPTTSQTVLAWGEPVPGRHWRLEVDTTRRLRFVCGTGYAVASRVVGDTHWHHVAVALDPLVPSRPRVSDIRLYVDARPQTVYEMNEQNLVFGDVESLQIGAPHDPATSQPFNGIVDDLRLYDAALSPAAIRRVHDEALPR
ncbi:MAG: hypothetical protein FJ280_13805 [Planctomycetes bacterium]|nr:hypothetical protein [Planctomycetota bacterium]